MSGSMEVNAKLTAWSKLTEKALEAAMDQHIKGSESFAKTGHRWIDRTGGATGSITSKTDSGATEITSAVGSTIMTNVYLEQRGAFQGRYKILEQARSNNLTALWARIKGIMSAGRI